MFCCGLREVTDSWHWSKANVGGSNGQCLFYFIGVDPLAECHGPLGVPRPHFENHCSTLLSAILLLQKLIHLLVKWIYPHHQLIQYCEQSGLKILLLDHCHKSFRVSVWKATFSDVKDADNGIWTWIENNFTAVKKQPVSERTHCIHWQLSNYKETE